MRRGRSQLAVVAVAIVLGFFVVLQIRSQAGNDLANRSAQELTVIVANLNTRNDQLRTEVSNLQVELADLQAAAARGQTSAEQVREDTERIMAWTGLLPITGDGVRVRIDGPIHPGAVDDLLNELRSAGAEGVAINGVRDVPGVTVGGQPGALSIDGHAVIGTLTIEAIGDPNALGGTLTRAGGIVAQLAATEPGAAIDVEPVDRLDLPATDRSLRPADGVPRL